EGGTPGNRGPGRSKPGADRPMEEAISPGWDSRRSSGAARGKQRRGHRRMTTTIRDAFDLPRPQDIRAMDFVIKLREADPSSDEVRQLVEDYVITPTVEKELPRILDDMKQIFDRGEEYGRFIHGSFGSGKSHFMTMLALLIETAAPAWKKFRPLLNAHRDAQQSKGRDAPEHEAWLSKAKLL